MRDERLKHLQQACRQGGADWAVLLKRNQDAWAIELGCKLTVRQQQDLLAKVGSAAFSRFLDDCLAARPRVRSRSMSRGSKQRQRVMGVALGEMQLALFGSRSANGALRRACEAASTLLALQFAELKPRLDTLRAAGEEAQARFAAKREADSRLVQAAKMIAVGEMAAGIAHELNNPLTTVTGFAELILDEIPPDAAYRADVEMVLQEAQRARGVVRGLLDFARQGERMRSRGDLNEILVDALSLTRHFIHTSGVQLDLVKDDDLPWILVESNQLKQVFLNLIHNALHAMPAGGRLVIRTSLKGREGRQWAVVEIADNGTGIPQRDVERIFEPFYTTRTDQGGTGLGLTVSYGIVADHGGTIEVQSEPGQGSVFSVWLPT
jgi:signal transduction histidine kinase